MTRKAHPDICTSWLGQTIIRKGISCTNDRRYKDNLVSYIRVLSHRHISYHRGLKFTPNDICSHIPYTSTNVVHAAPHPVVPTRPPPLPPTPPLLAPLELRSHMSTSWEPGHILTYFVASGLSVDEAYHGRVPEWCTSTLLTSQSPSFLSSVHCHASYILPRTRRDDTPYVLLSKTIKWLRVALAVRCHLGAALRRSMTLSFCSTHVPSLFPISRSWHLNNCQ